MGDIFDELLSSSPTRNLAESSSPIFRLDFSLKSWNNKKMWSMLEQEFGGSKIPNFARFYDPFKIFYSGDFITVRITA